MLVGIIPTITALGELLALCISARDIWAHIQIPVPKQILTEQHNVMLAIVIFINKQAFFITFSRTIRFGTIHALSNRQVDTITTALRGSYGFIITQVFQSHQYTQTQNSSQYVRIIHIYKQLMPMIMSQKLNNTSEA